MAQRTISDAGGNFNSTATWVEGVVPTSSDHIVATATSGQLTVNVASTVQYADLSGYTNTLTMNASLTLGLAGATTTFGAGMDFLPASPWATAQPIICNVNHTFVQNTTNIIPWLRFIGGTKTLSTNMYIGTLEIGNNNTAINGNTIFINLNLIGGFGTLSGNTILRLVGTGSVSVPTFSGVLVFDTLGTYTFTNTGIGMNTGVNISYVSGTLVNGRLKPLSSGISVTLDLGGTQWFSYDAGGSATINLLSDFNVGVVNIAAAGETTFSGTGGLKTPTLSTQGGMANITGVNTTVPQRLVLNAVGTHTIGRLVANGFAASPSGPNLGVLRSVTPGTKATLNLTGNTFDSSVSYLTITDIDASGGNEIFANNCVLSNTDNITTTPPTGGGGGSFAFTYVN